MYSIANFGTLNYVNLSLMCPSCYNVTTNTYEIDIYYDEDNLLKYTTKLVSNHNRYTSGLRTKCSCPKCKDCNPIILDGKLAEVISILNKKGYHTNFSCEGHNYGKYGNSQPYISFDGSIPLRIFEDYPLPDGWFLEIDADMNYFKRYAENTDIAIYYSEFSKSDDLCKIRFDRKALFNWAKSLPKNIK